MQSRRFGSAVTAAVVLFALAIGLPAAASAASWAGLIPDTDGPIVPTSTAPWSVLVDIETNTESVNCTGTIINATHILTAGHCMFDEDTNQEFPIGDIAIGAGSATDFSYPQVVPVSSVAVMPGYVSSTTTEIDDIAELTLAQPLSPSSSVESVALGQASLVAAGTSASFYGWGEVSNGVVDDYEHYLTDVIQSPWVCADGSPSTICASSQTGDSCPGDSGAGLVVQNGVPELVGVLDYSLTTQNAQCVTGHITGFTDITSPQVADWIAGNANPPLAPRAQGNALITAQQPQVGGTATCTSPIWNDASSTSYLFMTLSGTVLQNGAQNTLVLPTSAAGQSIQCVAAATSPGGTSYSGASTGTAVIQPQTKPTLALSITASGTASVTGADASQLTLTLTATATGAGASKLMKTFKVAADDPASVKGLPVGAYSLCLASADAGVYAATQVCKRWVKNGKALSYVSARSEADGLVLTAQSPAQRKTVQITWSARGHASVHTKVRLTRKATVKAPAALRGHWKAVVTVPREAWHGATLTGGKLTAQA